MNAKRSRETEYLSKCSAEALPRVRRELPADDLLAYMADMLHELQAISSQNGWRTLGGLLALAQDEAAMRRDEAAGKAMR